MHECGCKENILSGDNLFILQSPRNAMTAILALEYPGTDLLVHYTQILRYYPEIIVLPLVRLPEND